MDLRKRRRPNSGREGRGFDFTVQVGFGFAERGDTAGRVEEIHAEGAFQQRGGDRPRKTAGQEVAGDPPRFLGRRRVGVVPVEHEEFGKRAARFAVDREFAGERGTHDVPGKIEGVGTREEGDDLVAFGGVVADAAGFEKGGDEADVLVLVRGRPRGADGEDLFGVARGEFAAGRGADAVAGEDGGGIPRFSGAKSIEVTRAEVGPHLLRRDDDDADVPAGFEPCGSEPAPEKERVGGMGRDDAEDEGFAAVGVDVSGEGRGIADARVGEATGEGDGVAVEIEDERGETLGGGAVDAVGERERERGGGVGGVEFAVGEFGADAGPAEFAAKDDAQSVAFEDSVGACDEQRGAVGQRHEAEPDPGSLPCRAGRGGWTNRDVSNHSGDDRARGMPVSKSGPMNAPKRFRPADESASYMKPPIDSRQLHAFGILARTGSFTQTARELFLTQSAISHSMKALERDVGCRLLDRMGRKVMLTQAGEHLLKHAERVLAEMEQARDGLEELGKWGRGRLRIGASATMCQYVLPAVLREFKESFPQCQLMIEPGDGRALVEAVDQRHVDLALTLEPQGEDRFEFVPLFTDDMVFVVSALHPWATAGHVTRAEIARQNFIIYSKQSMTWRMTESYFRTEDTVLNTVIELGSMEAIKELVKVGLGITVMAPWVARKELEERSLVALPVGRRKLRRSWGIVHWKGRRLTLAEETFIGLCKSATDAGGGVFGTQAATQ